MRGGVGRALGKVPSRPLLLGGALRVRQRDKPSGERAQAWGRPADVDRDIRGVNAAWVSGHSNVEQALLMWDPLTPSIK